MTFLSTRANCQDSRTACKLHRPSSAQVHAVSNTRTKSATHHTHSSKKWDAILKQQSCLLSSALPCKGWVHRSMESVLCRRCSNMGKVERSPTSSSQAVNCIPCPIQPNTANHDSMYRRSDVFAYPRDCWSTRSCRMRSGREVWNGPRCSPGMKASLAPTNGFSIRQY